MNQLSNYWASMTPKQRSAEMRRRLAKGQARKSRAAVPTPEPTFPKPTGDNVADELKCAVEHLRTVARILGYKTD